MGKTPGDPPGNSAVAFIPLILGAFTLAKELELPILPIVINGSKDTLPKHSLNFHGRQFCRIDVLPAIEPSSFANLSVEQLNGSVYKLIAKRVDEHAKAPTDSKAVSG